MLVSIIIPHRNLRKEWLKECIDSVNAQSFKDFELIEALGEDLSKIHKAVQSSKGEFVLVLSDDDKLPPNFLEVCVKEMINKDVDIVATFIENFGLSEGRHGPDRFPFFTSMFRRSIYDEVGGFDADMKQMLDVEFWWRCLKTGASWIVTPDTFYYYRVHGTQDSVTCDWSIPRAKVISKHKDYTW